MRTDPMALPRAARWRESFGGSPGLWDYLSHQGGATLAVAFAALFSPSFIEFRGCILLAEHFSEDNFEHWWQRLDGRRGEVEAIVNHLHLWDLFDPEEVPDLALVELAQVLAGCWRAALAAEFPNRAFAVTVTDTDDDYGPTVVLRSTGG